MVTGARSARQSDYHCSTNLFLQLANGRTSIIEAVDVDEVVRLVTVHRVRERKALSKLNRLSQSTMITRDYE
jgi:hypothetical protein